MTEIAQSVAAGPPPTPERTAQLRQVAQDLEASFLAEMLRHAGAGAARDTYGGGVGEEQFSSFLRNDCLLYTSPSPRDGLLSRMPSSA